MSYTSRAERFLAQFQDETIPASLVNTVKERLGDKPPTLSNIRNELKNIAPLYQMNRTKPTSSSRKRRSKKKTEQVEQEVQLEPKELLKLKLKQKLKEKLLERKPRAIIENRMDDLEEVIETSKSATERRKAKEELALLNSIQERQLNSVNEEFPEYADKSSYGGAMERSE